MTESYTQAVNTARDYYNSNDADNFYFHIWGGEDIHVGLYQHDEEAIFDASRRTVEQMARKLGRLDEHTSILDIGGGYGGAMRHLVRTTGCRAAVLNISEVENERDRQMNREQGCEDRIDVIDGDFANIPFDDGSFDGAWSQDAILHSDDRTGVVRETARVLNPGAKFVFTDPMQTDDCPDGVLQPIYDRIHLESLASPGFYRRAGEEAGLEFVEFEEHADQIARHYGRVLKELMSREAELKDKVSDDYIERMKKGLRHWVDGGNAGYLTWGIFTFRKPA
ncbi:methyltransferase domain-containing protein [Kiritimatiella glycovorans]|uniref:Sarcosine/dimethylglycine N-methyltransferase n=1 Tax=Kiritimatiella glycovorans TaxID=1307763 RepID=A0A0G3EG49_9BACT|nr:methyltransferase domain-containing protein [Kiritimatiella glycovorans]AKJ65303.1 Sarcosine/dimethylglycine N-methyltransferase [Kiritimatiella glycovorans]